MNKKSLAIVLVFIGLFVAGTITAQFKLNAIKPSIKGSGSVTDEQQAILAVRKAKASVVSVTVKQSFSLENYGADPVDVDSAYGTGIIVSSDGYVVTNSHVAYLPEGGYLVAFADGSSKEAKLVGVDKYHDIALLKVEASGLPTAIFGNSDDLETGQSVFAIGNSLGRYQNSVSRGVVSGLGRKVSAEDGSRRPRFLNLIQTDAAISVGNSGGPLVNMLGEVVGINTLIDDTGESLGFAISSNTVKSSFEQLKILGKVSAPYFGVSFVSSNEVLKVQKNLASSEGALILEVVKGEPAEKAGIRPGDLIVEFNREKITPMAELDTLISKYSAGNQVLVTLFRGQEKLDIPVILGEYK